MDDNFTIDFILTEFFPQLKSTDAYSCVSSKNEESDVCVGYISDVLSLCLRAISESIKFNINSDRLTENQLVRLEMCGKRISLFAGLTKLWLNSLPCKEYYNSLTFPTSESGTKEKTMSGSNTTPQRRRAARTSKIAAMVEDKSDIDGFNLNDFDSVSGNQSIEKPVNIHVLYCSASGINFNFTFHQFLSMFRLDISTLNMHLDNSLSDSVKQQIGFVLFSSFLAAKFTFLVKETEDADLEPFMEEVFPFNVRYSVENYLKSNELLLSPFQTNDMRV